MLQNGTPEELFNRPRPGYVAGIVGARNLISGETVSETGSDLGKAGIKKVVARFVTAADDIPF